LFSPFDCFVMIAIRKDKQWPATAKLYLNLQKEWYTNHFTEESGYSWRD